MTNFELDVQKQTKPNLALSNRWLPSPRTTMGSDILSPLFNSLGIAATQRHSVTEAQSGAQALKLLEAGAPFDIVVTDYAIPGMNVFELAQRIKEKNPKLPIIMATGYAELPADRSIEFGHLSLPYTSTDLASALERAVH